MPQLSANLVFGTLLDVNVGEVSLTARIHCILVVAGFRQSYGSKFKHFYCISDQV